MSTKAALVEINNFIRVFKAFESAQYSLQALEGLEENIRDLTDKKEQLRRAVESIQKEIADARGRQETMNKKYKEAEAKAEEELSIYKQAIIRDAQTKAEEIISKAKEEEAEVHAKVMSLYKEETKLQKDIQEKLEVYKSLEDKLNSVQSSINTLLNIGK